MSKKYVYSHDGYVGMNPDCGIVEANSDFEAILEVFGFGEGNEEIFAGFLEECFDYEGPLDNIPEDIKEQVIENLTDANGDGQPYYIIKDEDGNYIFGEGV